MTQTLRPKWDQNSRLQVCHCAGEIIHTRQSHPSVVPGLFHYGEAPFWNHPRCSDKLIVHIRPQRQKAEGCEGLSESSEFFTIASPGQRGILPLNWIWNNLQQQNGTTCVLPQKVLLVEKDFGPCYTRLVNARGFTSIRQFVQAASESIYTHILCLSKYLQTFGYLYKGPPSSPEGGRVNLIGCLLWM